MSKKNKEKRWCDNQHKPPKDTYFIIGKLAGELYTSAENYLIHDINKDMSVVYEDEAQNKIARNYVIKKLYNILDTAEKLENAVYSANAIYAWYDIDFAARRKGWIKAKGLCFELSTQLNHVGTKTLKGTNLQKYVDLSKDAKTIAHKIDNMIKSDDKKRKQHPRTYIEDGSDKAYEGISEDVLEEMIRAKKETDSDS